MNQPSNIHPTIAAALAPLGKIVFPHCSHPADQRDSHWGDPLCRACGQVLTATSCAVDGDNQPIAGTSR